MRQSLRLMTYNLQACTQTNMLLATLEEYKNKIDVLCLQEVVAFKGQSEFVEKLSILLGGSWHVESFFDSTLTHDLGLVVALKKRKCNYLNKHTHYLPEVKNYTFLESITKHFIGLGDVTLKRKALSILFTFAEVKIYLTNIHLSLEGGKKQRIQQLQYLYGKIQNVVESQIICGDFNTLHFDGGLAKEQQNIQHILSEFEDSTKEITITADATRYTYPTLFNKVIYGSIHFLRIHLYQKLDYIWVKNFHSSDVKMLNIPGSDHFPVLVTLSHNHA